MPPSAPFIALPSLSFPWIWRQDGQVERIPHKRGAWASIFLLPAASDILGKGRSPFLPQCFHPYKRTSSVCCPRVYSPVPIPPTRRTNDTESKTTLGSGDCWHKTQVCSVSQSWWPWMTPSPPPPAFPFCSSVSLAACLLLQCIYCVAFCYFYHTPMVFHHLLCGSTDDIALCKVWPAMQSTIFSPFTIWYLSNVVFENT